MVQTETSSADLSSHPSGRESPSRTVVDATENGHGDASKLESGIAAVGERDKLARENEDAAGAPAVKLSQGRKWFLLLIFSVAQYLDICSYSGVFLFTDAIAGDLNIKYLSSTWVITAYSVTFASFLLLWGRIADLYSAKPVFAYGFLGLGVTNLIISFMPEQYSYFVFRAISGIFGAATIPAAFRLIPSIFEPHEMNVALTLFGLSGAIANITGLIFAGFFGFIKTHDQNAAWRWFYRMITIVIVPFAIAAFGMIPHTSGAQAGEVQSRKEKIKRSDYPGAFLMLTAIILMILGMTLGATYGFKTAKFLVPFLLSWPLFVAFFIWEWKLPTVYALIPPSFWFLPNMPLLMFTALTVYSVWGFILIGFLQTWQVVNHQSAIITAVRFLPAGISAFCFAMMIPPLLKKISPRWPIVGGFVLAAVGYILFIYSHGNLGKDYWRYDFPGLIVGTGSTMAAFLAVNITVMTSVPPETSGVAGAMLQVCLQLGAVLGLSIQAGLLTLKPGSITNEYNVQASYWFIFGWALFVALLVLVFFKDTAAPGSEKAKEMEQQKAEGSGEVATPAGEGATPTPPTEV